MLGGDKYCEEEKIVCKEIKNNSRASTVLYKASYLGHSVIMSFLNF